MRNLLIRILMIAGMLIAAGQSQATTVYIQGALTANATYYAYDGPLYLTGHVSHSDFETRDWGGWIVHYGDVYSSCMDGVLTWTHWSVRVLGKTFSYVCDAPITWLDAGHTSEWFNSTNLSSFTIGPENMLVKPDSFLDGSSAPADLVWTKDREYKIRLFAFSDAFGAGGAQSTERTIKYMGAPFAADRTADNQRSHPGNYSIEISSGSITTNNDLHYIMHCNTTVYDKSSPATTWDEQYTNNDSVYKSTIDTNGSRYKVGHTYHARTLCEFRPNGNLKTTYVIFSHDNKYNREFHHEFEVAANGTPVNDVKINPQAPVLITLTGRFNNNGSVRVRGRFDDISPFNNPAFKYRIGLGGNFITPDHVTWNPDSNTCTRCFSFDISADKLLASDKISPVQVLPDVHTDAQAAHPDIAAFPLRDFIDAGFEDAKGVTWACGEANEVTVPKDSHGNPQIKLKLTVKHAIDRVTGYIWLPQLPVSYQGSGTISYTAPGQSAADTKDISISENDKGKSEVHWLSNTIDLVLKPGTYIISLPVKFPSYQRKDVSNESLVLYSNVYAAKSIMLKQRDSFPDPEAVQCMVMFNGTAQ